MMASNLLSRLLPESTRAPSVYESMNQHDQYSDTEDSRDQGHDMALDERNLDEHFQEQDIEAALADDTSSQVTTESTAFPPQRSSAKPPIRSDKGKKQKAARDLPATRALNMEDDDDVPQSLLLEHGRAKQNDKSRRRPNAAVEAERLPSPVPGPSTRSAKKQWETTRGEQRVYTDVSGRAQADKVKGPLGNGRFITDPKEKALWRWSNVQNLDKFLGEVYAYHQGQGIWSILWGGFLNLLSMAFVVGFLTFLTFCIDYSLVPKSTKMHEVIVQQCTKKMSFLWNLLLWIFCIYWLQKLISLLRDIPRLWHMHDFFHYLLEIPDSEIQTVSWQIVIRRLMTTRDSNPMTAEISPRSRKFLTHEGDLRAKQRMDAHDIANRLMRKENYLIALFNKEVLDLSVPGTNSQFFSETIMWCLHFCILNFAFNDEGLLNPLMLQSRRRREIVDRLKARIRLAAWLSIPASSLLAIYYIVTFALTWGIEFQRNPSALGQRVFTPLALWKFREFNELPHTFHRRTSMAIPFANRYLEQFPKAKMVQLYNFLAFIASSVAIVLFLATVWDSELFLGFEITHGRTVIFYLTTFSAIYAAARGAIPEDHLVFDPEYALEQVIYYTRYYPSTWKNRLHSDEVRRDFLSLYQLKLAIIALEFASALCTPLILFWSLPKSAEKIVDFFREFTVEVDGVGHVCSFAVFEFQKNQTDNLARRKLGDLREDYHNDKHDKKMYSLYAFLDEYHDGTLQNARHNRGASASRFLPPPTFPGLGSPHLGAEAAGVSSSRYGGAANLRKSTYQTPRFGPDRGQPLASPMHSMLLDPHHQPRHTHPPALEEEEEEDIEMNPRTSSAALEDDSELGSSWRTTKRIDEAEEPARPGDAGGVLGLLAQFSKATAEGRAAGI